MSFFLVGLNHNSAPVEVRERFAGLCVSGLPGADGKELEAVTVLTCNRVEAYFFGEEDRAIQTFSAWLAKEDRSFKEIEPYVYRARGEEAIRHLLKVAGGLDSMVLGENQILHQVKDSYQAAIGAGSVGKRLHALFQRALEVGKKIRHETKISENTVSIASAAVEMAKTIFGPLDHCTALVIGAGEMATLVARHLKDRGVGSMLFTNRTISRAEELAATFGGKAAPLDQMDLLLHKADVLVSSTGAPRPVILRDRLEQVMDSRSDRPLFAIDIAVPRDIEAGCGDIENVFLYNIDDLQNVVDENLNLRRVEAQKATAIVNAETVRFGETLNSFAVTPLIVAMRERAEAIRQAEFNRMFPAARSLDPQIKADIERLSRSLLSKWLHHPTVALKEKGSASEEELADLSRLFGLNGSGLAASPDPLPGVSPQAIVSAAGGPGGSLPAQKKAPADSSEPGLEKNDISR